MINAKKTARTFKLFHVDRTREYEALEFRHNKYRGKRNDELSVNESNNKPYELCVFAKDDYFPF